MNDLTAFTLCSAMTPDCRFDNSIFEFNMNVYCPKKMCSGIPWVHTKTFQSLGRSSYQNNQCKSTCQMRKVVFEEQINSLFLKCDQRMYSLGQTQKSIQGPTVYRLGQFCALRSCVYVHTSKANDKNCYICLQCKACWHVSNNLLKNRKPTIVLFGGDRTSCFVKKTSPDYET